ncbi:hypothetical protein D3C73_1028450 [compost metagenome]
MSPLTVVMIRVCASLTALSAAVVAAGEALLVLPALLAELVLADPVEQALSTMVKQSSKVISNDGLAVLDINDAPSDLY